MTTKELMVGDYITFSDVQNDSNCPKLKVVIIDDGDVYVSNDGDPVVDLLDSKDLAGIPLTPEILEKNGFRRANEQETALSTVYMSPYPVRVCEAAKVKVVFYDLPIGGVNVLVQIEADTKCGGGVNSLHSCDIENVHQLQHALRLCGIEKEIEL